MTVQVVRRPVVWMLPPERPKSKNLTWLLLVFLILVVALASAVAGPHHRDFDPSKKLTVVTADDDDQPKGDLNKTARAAASLFRSMGFKNVEIIQCNTLDCIVQSCLYKGQSGPTGTQADVLVSDGGYVGKVFQLPPQAPIQSVPAASEELRGKVPYTNGAWIVKFLRTLGWEGTVLFVSTEGVDTFKKSKSRWVDGYNLEPILRKDWFYNDPARFAGELKFKLFP